MSKTDKELTVEIVVAHINAWNAKPNTIALNSQDVTDLIAKVYSAIKKLDA